MSVKSKRSFGLSAEDVQELAAEYAKTKRLPCPYRNGAYAHAIAALVTLGANKPHSLAKLHQAFKRAAGAEWYAAWAGTEKRNEETGLDADGRFLQNLRVLQRTSDYGLKLLEAGQKVMGTKGAVIDLSRDSKGAILVSLNTDSSEPLKPGRSLAETKVVREPSGKGGKATRSKSKGKTAAKRKTSQKASDKPRKATPKVEK